jgi:hypothetical protein
LAKQNEDLHVDVPLSTPSTLPEGVSTTTVFDAAISRGAISATSVMATTTPTCVDAMVMAIARKRARQTSLEISK